MHIVFHGCLQSRTTDGFGDAFIDRTGYLGYADDNRIVLLYPQTNANTAPNSCWDWWGYASSDHLSRGAPQLAAVRAMLDRLGRAGTSCKGGERDDALTDQVGSSLSTQGEEELRQSAEGDPLV